MDMAPPQAPPAIVRPADNDAGALIARLSDNHRWLGDQQSVLPALPTGTEPAAKAAFMAELAAFWNAPVEPHPGVPPVARALAFGVRWASTMGDEARLRTADGSLSERARDSVLAFAATQGHVLPPELRVRRLLVGAMPYAGAVVLVDGRADGIALLFTPDRGWEEFAKMDTLHDTFEQRLGETLAATGHVPGMSDEDLGGMDGDIAVSSADIDGNIMATLVGEIIDLQRQKVSEAWDMIDSGNGSALRLADRVREALAPAHYLDVATILLHRRARLFTTMSEARLAQLPLQASDEWRATAADYRRELVNVEQTLAGNGFADVASIDQFAREALGKRLAGFGIADDPADIVVELFTTTANTTHGYSGTDVDSRTLVELARENIGFLDQRGMQAKTVRGGLLLQLRRDDIIDMVRALDLRNSYQNYLVARFKTSTEGQRVRRASIGLQESRMRFELADARSTAYVAGEAHDFIDDHAERGYRWVKAVLDAPDPSSRPRVEGHEIVVRHIVYEGARLKDVLVIGVRSQGSVYRTVLYTPDAPDGRSFREFADRRGVAREFLHDPAFEQYLLERLPARWSTVGADGITRRFRVSEGTRRAVWALSGQRGELPHTLTEGRFGEEEIVGNFLEASYDVALGQLGWDATELARSTGVADYEKARSIGTLAARFAEGFLPVRIGVAAGGIRALYALWQGVEHAERGERNQAFEDFVDAFSSSTDLIGSNPFRRSLARAAFVRPTAMARQLAAGGTKTPVSGHVFEARYAAANVSKKAARTVENGIYDIGDRRYIEHHGQLYGVRFDRDNATWRLAKPNPSPTDYGPPVVRDATGEWRHNRGVGLRGGMDDRPDLSDKSPLDVLREHRASSADTAALSDNDLEIVVRTLEQHGIASGSAKRLIYDCANGRPATRAMMEHWQAAIAEARRPPPRIRTPSPPSLQGFQLVKLERSQWPTTVWHYTTTERHATFRGRTLALQQSQPTAWGPSGVHVMTLDPTRSSRKIAQVMRGQVRAASFTEDRVGQLTGAYVEVNLGKLRDRQKPDGTYEFNLYTVANRSPHEFVIKPTPSEPQLGVAPASPREFSALPSVLLRPGEFKTGRRTPSP